MYSKNQLVTVTIEDISDTGEGIGHIDGFTLFVSRAVPGDTVQARILKAKKTYAFAKTGEILTPSPSRTEPLCPLAGSCGGCQLSYMTYEAQLALKQKKVEDCVRRIGGFADVPVLPIIGMDDPRGYRNKGQFPVGTIRRPGQDSAAEPVLGFYAGRSHRIVPAKSCPMLWDGHEKILSAVREYLAESGVKPYDEETGKGLVRHVLMRKGFATGEILVCMVINGPTLPKANLLWKKLSEIPGVVSLSININTENTNVILGAETKTLFGPGAITDRIGDVTFSISPASFYQVNPVQTEVLYNLALEYADLTGNETVWDLYCGIGTISLFLARKAKKVYGVEIIPQAIEDARENARLNGFMNTEFFVGKAEEVLPEWYEAHPEEQIDVITVDPPRKGCDEKCLETIGRMQPLRVVYVSCDSATLARDLRILTEQYGYCVEKVQPVDQFSQTVEVETVCRLSKRAKKL
ncbi:MAG: 23S rRNA (uracil(1939)-C(5))-methyltransferase RlmD [Lachnospiraceae bacterium]|nr:23S rRNA (uracil(1939)-C(5))-methyltransferase RlmD [Lachnospiraceae bacterium]